MRILLAVATLALAAAADIAQSAPKVSPPHTMSTANLRPSPRVYTMDERAGAVQRYMKATKKPVLGEPFSLTPAVPHAVGRAVLALNNAEEVFGGVVDNYGSPGGVARLNVIGSGVEIGLKTRGGKHYAFDCRTDISDASVGYSIESNNKIIGNGTVFPSQDGHVVFATEDQAQDLLLTVTIYYISTPDTRIAQWSFYGCEISPF